MTRPTTPGDAGARIEPEWKIENVVATAFIELEDPGEKIDLNHLARKYTGCDYNPDRFPGLVMRIGDAAKNVPKATILIFSTGKMVVTGLRQAGEVEAVVENVIGKLKRAKVTIKGEPEITVQNIVASGDLHVLIDLNEAAVTLENAMYEPEVFPGLIYRMQEPKTVFLLFSTGRIVCTGGKTKESVGNAIENLVAEVQARGLSRNPFDAGEELDLL